MDWIATAQIMFLRDEGLKLKPYKCPAGKLTIGIGRNLEDRGITKDEALAMLAEDIKESILAAQRIFGKEWFNELSPVRQLAIVNLIFQLGEVGFAKFHATIAAMKKHHWVQAKYHLMDSKWAKQTPKRAERVTYMVEYDLLPKSYQ